MLSSYSELVIYLFRLRAQERSLLFSHKVTISVFLASLPFVSFVNCFVNLKVTAGSASLRRCLSFRVFLAGVHSDTHLLALMYGGEICYWQHSLSSDQALKESVGARGLKYLKKYQWIIQSTPALSSWQTLRSHQLIAELDALAHE